MCSTGSLSRTVFLLGIKPCVIPAISVSAMASAAGLTTPDCKSMPDDNQLPSDNQSDHIDDRIGDGQQHDSITVPDTQGACKVR